MIICKIEKFENNYEHLPKLLTMQKLWHYLYWDGPISGLCLLDGAKCWYQMVDEWSCHNEYPDNIDFEAPWYRRFIIFKLTDEHLNIIELNHYKFQTMVGMHTTYDNNGHLLGCFRHTETINQDTVDQYYDWKKSIADLDISPAESQLIGWFED
jgi:hypothetical protein